MTQFKKNKDVGLIAERKIAMMAKGDNYNVDEIKELFETSYCCYLVYELCDWVDELIKGKNLQNMDAS